MERLTVVTDFDGTLMKQDVGDTLMERLGITRTPQLQEAARRYAAGEAGSKEWILAGYGQMGNRKAEVDAVLSGIQPREGAADLLQFCREQGISVTVLSDGMEYYIRQLMSRHGLRADEVIVNPIRYEADGSYSLGLQNRNPACSWCGCCKAEVIRGLKASGARVVYIGDGVSDTFGSSFADRIFARASLARYLQRQGRPFYPFETFHHVLRELRPLAEDWKQGRPWAAASESSNAGHPFCKFPPAAR